MSIRRCLPLAALVAVLATSAAPGLAAAPAPANLALRTTDLPKGFARTQFVVLDNGHMARLMKISKKELDKHGRVSGVVEVFVHGQTGLFEIASDVYEYKTAAGAIWDWQKQYARNLAASKRVAAPTVGDHSGGFATATSTPRGVYVAYGIDFQKGKWDMTVGVIATRGSASMNDAVRLARIVLSRVP